MSSEQERAELDAWARQGEIVVPGGTGGHCLEAQEHLAEGNIDWAYTYGGNYIWGEEQRRADEKGADRERRVLGDGSKGVLSTTDKSGGECAN
ncbi:hypothetical protein ACSBR2_007808 [Camellia fascicularis]